ncbi:MAG: DUF4149 domain-containing protein [Gammaproteobacteria bacterium]|jgi:hypothetical protein
MVFGSAVTIWLVGALIGSMLFFAFTVAPTVFRSLPADHAGLFLRAFFPRYYLWGLILALIAAAFAIPANAIVSTACFLVALLFVYVRQTLMPQINRARDDELQGMPGAGKRFKTLHMWSVAINGFQMLILLAVAVLLL